MKKIIVFEMVTLDGFFAGPNGEIDWHNTDGEFGRFADEQTQIFGTHIFGRTTHDLMFEYWSKPEAEKGEPIVTKLMRETPKIVFSKTIKPAPDSPTWKNVTVLREIRKEEVLKWKNEDGKPIAIFGSGQIVQQFANLGLIDEYRLMINPLVLGSGRYLFKDVHKLKLKLLGTRTFQNGNILLTYAPEELNVK